MPHRLLRADGHDRKRSLGWLGTWWIETFVVHGPGDVVGVPVQLTDEYTGFVVDCYALDSDGRRMYDSAFLSRPKGCDKSGLASDLSLLEAFGPCRFDGWAEGGETYEFLGQVYTYAPGEPMGRPVTSPMVRIMATEEEQAGNVYAAIYYNLTDERAPLFRYAQAYGLVVNKKGVAIPSGGEVRPSTSGSASKDGGIETFAVFDETHLYVTPQLRSMHQTVTDNLGKRADGAEPWYIETTTMYEPGEESVAESTYEYADAIEEGRARKQRLLFDHRYATITDDDFRDEEKLAAAFREAYGDSLQWNPVQMLVARAYDPRRPISRTRRYRLNAVVAAQNAWVSPEDWTPRGRRAIRALRAKLGGEDLFTRPWKGDTITLGFDGSLTNDATALIAVRVRDRHVFPLHIQEVPDGPEAENWEVDQEAVDAAVAKAFEKFNVVGFYGDPPYWQDWVRAWAKEYGEQLVVKAGPKNEIAWWTKRDAQMSDALELLHTAIASGTMSHDDDTRLGRAMTRHFMNARKWSRRGGTVIGKEKKNSPRKIDAAVAAALAFQAAADFEAKKPPEATGTFVPFRVR